ncbi:2-C-methyl-D-erythritol 4-phosphate cytidylyltransferase [Sporomusa termitida]|uniref:2-C-methyl-D-erythritol 4-phosphate cytidylyltransferase n=2 Tax=Sporomusa termitida TaxID=2377 RepID=A0A517DX78_9FIRM|nr:2-C-methyl-D-erythritol 4-phosphate cytidylyltransferase [Sporomusa termitida]
MNSRAKPKQFLELHGKPVLLYTLDHFEEHQEIDHIIVVCLENWINELQLMLHRYDFKKIIKIVPGGSTGHESIYNGLKAMENICNKDDIVLIHDGVRPLISEELISENIAKAKKYNTAITAEAAKESVVQSRDGARIDHVPERSTMYVAKAPQSFNYPLIWKYYQMAQKEGLLSIDSAHLLSIYGVEMHMVKSTPNNMKITAPTDYYIFRALYEAMENKQILGI